MTDSHSYPDIVERLRKKQKFARTGYGYDPTLEIDQECIEAANEIERLRGVAQEASDCGVTVEREDLADMIESWEDAANYKGDYLREKHGDTEEIAKYRAKYLAVPSTNGGTAT